jgi:hypothetical protein
VGRRIDDAVGRKLVRILKAGDRCRGARSVPPIDLAWFIPQPTQLALKPFDAIYPIRAGTLPKACSQRIPGAAPNHAVDCQIVRLLKAPDSSGGDRTVATVDGARLKAQPAELALKGFDLFDALGGGLRWDSSWDRLRRHSRASRGVLRRCVRISRCRGECRRGGLMLAARWRRAAGSGTATPVMSGGVA